MKLAQSLTACKWQCWNLNSESVSAPWRREGVEVPTRHPEEEGVHLAYSWHSMNSVEWMGIQAG